MKKKELEGLPAEGRKKGKPYYLSARVFALSDGSETLVVDAYGKKELIRRYCYDAENYATYLPKEKKWSRRKILPEDGYWGTIDFCGEYARKYREHTSIAMDTDEIIRNFAGITETKDTVLMLRDIQNRIDEEKRKASIERKAEKAREATEGMPETSEAFKKFAKEIMGENSFYYIQQGRDIFLTCSKCGKTDHIKGTMLIYQKHKECYFCGCEVKRIRKAAEETGEEKTEIFSDIRPYGEGVAVIQVDVTKRIHIAKPEEWEFKEIGAAVFLPKRRTQDIYWKEENKWTKNQRMERRESYGYYGRYETKIPESGWAPEYAKDTLRAAGFKNTGYECYERNLYSYLRAWAEHPEIEYLSKMGLTDMVHAMIESRYALKDLNTEGHSFSEIFGIRPDRKKFLIKSEGDLQTWSILKAEYKQNACWGEDAIQFFRKNIEKYNEDRLFTILTLKTMTAEKLKNYLKKQIKHFRTINSTLQEYHDYLKLTKDMGYDLTDQVVLFPKDLKAKHDERLTEKDREKTEKRAHEFDEKFRNVKKNYKRLEKRFGYRTDSFIIRPARDCTEIVKEGSFLHHCVGATDQYCRKHNDGKTFILFMRRSEEPDRPWCTIEIDNEGSIRQWFEAHDQKPDKDIIQPVLDEYVKQLAK